MSKLLGSLNELFLVFVSLYIYLGLKDKLPFLSDARKAKFKELSQSKWSRWFAIGSLFLLGVGIMNLI